MSSPVMIDDSMFASVNCDLSPGPKARSSESGQEPKRAFADTAPMAKIREESKSSEADLREGQASAEEVSGCESQPAEQTTGPQGTEPPAEDTSADPDTEALAGQAATPVAEGPVVQGNPAAVVPVKQMLVDAQPADAEGQAQVAEQPTVGNHPVTAEPAKVTAGEPSTIDGSQGLVNKDVTSNGGSAVEAGTTPSLADGTRDSAERTAAEAGKGVDVPQGKTDVADVVAKPESGTTAPDAGPVVTRDAVSGSEVDVVAAAKTDVIAPEATKSSGEAQQQPTESAPDANVNASNPENGGSSTGIPQAVERDPGRSDPAGDKSAPHAQGNVRSEGEAVPTTADTERKDGALSDANKEGTKSQTEVLVSSPSGTSAFAERVAARSAGPSDGGAPVVKNPVQDVGEQILSSVQASLVRGDKQLLVRLDPPELGSVVVRFQEQGDQVSGVLEVNREETRREVEQALPQVLRSLQEAGVQVRRLEVADQAARDPDREQMQQDAWAQREGMNQQGEHTGGPYRSYRSSSGGVSQSPFEQTGSTESHSGIRRGRIDMLV